ncbi:hypothetical protein NEMIN01_0285 [Nematocida minor]|uniref:uncharacterized protein n=1 Tax=Nematocida minor TaxID=1912983 RepID=UPI00221F125E|nr:uncharacterized protein NEMIN01_0285 [Nematocida minor]KAI5189119.1 hypothetical protein NEMIN01_0285 [Nematocida minor]
MPDHKPPTKRQRKRIFKNITYASLIIKAIQDSPYGRCTIDEVCAYIAEEYPNDLPPELVKIWQGCVRQVLSRDARFIKLARRTGCRVSEWIYFPPSYQPSVPPTKPLSLMKHIRTVLRKKGEYKEFYIKKPPQNGK